MSTPTATTPSAPATPAHDRAVTGRRRPKARYFIALAVCAGAIVWMITSLSENINYLETVSEAVKHRATQQHRDLRVGGVVVRHSIRQTRDGADFRLGDGKDTIAVHVTNIPSKLFADCAPVVVEGQWKGTAFAGDNLLVRHGANYGASSGTDKKNIKDALAGTGCQKSS